MMNGKSPLKVHYVFCFVYLNSVLIRSLFSLHYTQAYSDFNTECATFCPCQLKYWEVSYPITYKHQPSFPKGEVPVALSSFKI